VLYIAQVAMDGTSLGFDTPFCYLIPDHLKEDIKPMVRVNVPFGRGDRHRQGIVLSVTYQEDSDISLKSIYSVIDDKLCDDEWEKLICFLRESTFCTYYDAVKTILPTSLGIKISEYYRLGDETAGDLSGLQVDMLDFVAQNGGKVKADKLHKQFGIVKTNAELISLLDQKLLLFTSENKKNYIRESVLWVKIGVIPEKLTDKQRLVVDYLSDLPAGVTLKECLYHTGVTRAVVMALQKKGAVEVFEQFDYKMAFNTQKTADIESMVLSDEQQRVFDAIDLKSRAGEYGCNLIYGITGSGKTSIYLKLIDSVVKQGKTAIMLVPEISLTPQMIRQFTGLFGKQVALMHSMLSAGEKNTEYRRISDGEAKIVIGTRSAVFAPLKNIGLIILDEEQESSYHSDSSPRYHAAQIAAFRAKYHGAQVVFGSATPKISTYHKALMGQYELFELHNRYGQSVLPAVTVVDMKEELAAGNSMEISMPLRQQLQKNLQEGKQSILLLNRRGYNTSLVCTNCGAVARCKHCDIPLTYHRAVHRLVCHYCGRSFDAATVCDNCGGNHVAPYGAGTQKVQEELNLLFPDAKVLRMDTDTTSSKNAYQENFDDFGAGKYDILIGTQMVAKGLNFPNVTLVGVLGIDNTLNGSSYLSFERAFSLITQVVGRGGRGVSPARAIIQTMEPDNSVICHGAAQDYRSFYSEEIALRKKMLYPPFCDLCLIGFSGTDREKCLQAAKTFASCMEQLVTTSGKKIPIRLMGPTPYGVEKVNDKYRYKIICKCVNNRDFRAVVRQTAENMHSNRLIGSVHISVDMYPDSEI